MKSTEELSQAYENYLDYLRCGRYGFTYEELDQYTVEELETLASFGWSDQIGEELYEIFILRRKRKMNEQFVFNQKNINAIVQINQQLTDGCRQLKHEAETEFSRLLERRRADPNNFFFSLTCKIDIGGSDSFLDCAISVMDDSLLFLALNGLDDMTTINLLPIFDFNRNYADKILTYRTEQAMKAFSQLVGGNIGFAFYKLYHDSCMSLQDILGIVSIGCRVEHSYSIIQNRFRTC
ncbi:MAG: hypothetical protein FWC41_01255 [Firmicutes bacterium]|nr:hypothetical protein [Bacillota bacterium]